MPVPAIVVQCFNKPDTLGGLLASLLRCKRRERFRLWLWLDHFAGGRRDTEFAEPWQRVKSLAETFAARCRRQFRAIEVRINDHNCGPYRTCAMAIAAALGDADHVIFSEDDTVFATDALEWFETGWAQGLLDDNGWAIAGESIFFDSRQSAVPAGFVDEAIAFAQAAAHYNKFVRLPFLPSTCFATSAARWRELGHTRGLTNGDTLVNRRCAQEGKHCVFPVIARVKDIGMLHRHGYSVTIHGPSGVKEMKNTYLMSDMLGVQPASAWEALAAAEAGPLFDRSVNLKGFDR